jgi:catechol 2,3-dioxygenase-like lactoylglutathione lyase family enzyme
MMTNATIRHVNLPVLDLERSLAFYCDVLGFRFVKSFVRSDGKVGKVMLDHRGFDLFLEQSDDAARLPANFHFGLQADRTAMLEIARRLEALAIDVGAGPVESPAGSGMHRFYFRDPDGTIIEIYDEA